MRIAKALGTIAVSAGLFFSMATNSYAADASWYTNDGDPGGRIEWTANGDIVRVCDVEADGYAAIGYVANGETTIYSLQAGGNGVCKTARASDGGTHDLAENRYYNFTICLKQSGSAPEYCDTRVFLT
ncbi:hypothetical protein [Streptomyces sp. NPDC096132]|uniref:hypothetical protein n=1 Tax=Streptomyces sp. NPDC096132 TaxID=3366075 RepID=UPI003829F693